MTLTDHMEIDPDVVLGKAVTAGGGSRSSSFCGS